MSTRLDQLLIAGEITREAWQPADQFRSTWERANGVGAARELEMRARRDRGALSVVRLDAAARLGATTEGLGKNAVWLIEQ